MDNTSILEQLFEKDYAVKEFELIPGKLTVKVRNIGFRAQSELEETLKNLRDEELSNRQFLQAYSINQLAHTIVSWGTTKYDNAYDWVNFLQEKSVASIDKALQEQQKFEKQVREAINIEDIKKPSSPEEPGTEGSGPSQKA